MSDKQKKERWYCPYCGEDMPDGREPHEWLHCGELGHAERSDTPKTDAWEQEMYRKDSCLVTEPTFPEMLEFARNLEREHANAMAVIEYYARMQLLNRSSTRT